MIVSLPWPDHPLWPNRSRRLHWAVIHRARKAQRAAVRRACDEAGVLPAASAAIAFEFYPPDQRRRDVDGCASALKGAIDEIAAVLGIDDSAIPIALPATFGAPVEGGEVVVEISIPA